MTLGSLFIQNYRAFGWFIIAASALGGGITIGPLLFFALRRPITAWLSRDLKRKNDRLIRERDAMQRECREVNTENVKMRANWGQAVIKATQGVATVLSAFGLDDKRGSDDQQ